MSEQRDNLSKRILQLTTKMKKESEEVLILIRQLNKLDTKERNEKKTRS